MNGIELRVSVEIYGRDAGQLRLSESMTLPREISLAEAAEIMGKISEVFKAIRASK